MLRTLFALMWPVCLFGTIVTQIIHENKIDKFEKLQNQRKQVGIICRTWYEGCEVMLRYLP